MPTGSCTSPDVARALFALTERVRILEKHVGNSEVQMLRSEERIKRHIDFVIGRPAPKRIGTPFHG